MLNATNYTAPSSDFVLIKGGSFTMGSPESEDWRNNDETQHRITLASFYMAKFEVTQKEWREITGKNPGNFTGEKLPVESITWLERLWKKSSFCLPCCHALKTKIDSKKWAEYDTIILGYPNWWASIPMPIATLLESYDFSGKTIMPFCSHGGGRFGQSLTAISKLAPKATLTEGLSIHYSGGASLSKDVEKWLKKCGVSQK